MSIERALKGVGVEWVKTRHDLQGRARWSQTLKEAMTTPFTGLKVIIADGECQLERQRRIRPLIAAALKAGERVVRTRFGVDEDVCTGDHSCIRLSGCPSLTVKDSSDPLKVDPVAHVEQRLRRLRAVRRGRARGDPVPVLLPRRDRAEPELVGPAARSALRAARDRLARSRPELRAP